MDHRRQSPSTSTKQDRLDKTAQAVTMALARHEHALGRPLKEISRELGVPFGTLRHWLAAPVATFRPVAITSPQCEADVGAEVAPLVVVTAHGHRIEGLDLAAAIAVLRELEAGA